MRKLLFIAILLLSCITYAQDTPFARNYTAFIKEGETDFYETNLTVIFNYQSTKNIMFYLNGEEMLLYRVSSVRTNTTTNGMKYQIFDCVVSQGGEKVSLQLFDTALRIFSKEPKYIEYHE
jgi:hypothetical protein